MFIVQSNPDDRLSGGDGGSAPNSQAITGCHADTHSDSRDPGIRCRDHGVTSQLADPGGDNYPEADSGNTHTGSDTCVGDPNTRSHAGRACDTRSHPERGDD